MNERVKRLTEEIRKLPPEEQAELIGELIVLTYREPDPEIDKAWAEEAERRADRFDSGREPGIESDEAIAQVRANWRSAATREGSVHAICTPRDDARGDSL